MKDALIMGALALEKDARALEDKLDYWWTNRKMTDKEQADVNAARERVAGWKAAARLLREQAERS